MLWAKKKSFVSFGAGNAARKHIIELNKRSCSLKAVFNPSGKNVTGFNCPVFRDLDALDKTDFDFAIIATPNINHLEQITYLLRRKIPFVVEKPIVANLEQLEFLTKHRHLLDKYCFVAHNLRFQSNTIFLKNWLSENKFFPKLIDVEWKRNIPVKENHWTSDFGKTGGGILIDWGPHAIDLVWHLLEDNRFNTTAAILEPKSSYLEDAVELSLVGEKSDVVINIRLSWVADKGENKPLQIHLNCADRTVSWHKSGKLYVPNPSGTTLIYDNEKNLMYDYFLENFILNSQNFEENKILLDRSFAVVDKILQIYREFK